MADPFNHTIPFSDPKTSPKLRLFSPDYRSWWAGVPVCLSVCPSVRPSKRNIPLVNLLLNVPHFQVDECRWKGQQIQLDILTISLILTTQLHCMAADWVCVAHWTFCSCVCVCHVFFLCKVHLKIYIYMHLMPMFLIAFEFDNSIEKFKLSALYNALPLYYSTWSSVQRLVWGEM